MAQVFFLGGLSLTLHRRLSVVLLLQVVTCSAEIMVFIESELAVDNLPVSLVGPTRKFQQIKSEVLYFLTSELD